MAIIWWHDFNLIMYCISLISGSEAITLKFIVADITSYVQRCLLKCFIVYLLS